ncbi:choice-of-anchor tandem repeat GloVer-containing protein [Methylocystis heyeri]|uniref:choice-of-anchor tandem repeat GloVer-containing protein n=1 Tax=Methylocystis heyeri TaxID=391905 RepID=UPI003CCDB373
MHFISGAPNEHPRRFQRSEHTVTGFFSYSGRPVALYGTPLAGGAGQGVVFKLTPQGSDCAPRGQNLWCETVLHAFGGSDGSGAISGLTMDSSGTLYGTTQRGGRTTTA